VITERSPKEQTMQLAIGQKVGSYLLLERIGNPNMGEVWRAHHELNTKAVVALKCVNKHLRHQPQMLERFERECAVQQRLSHPSIVPVRECIQHDGNLFLVMRFIAGGSLEDKLSALRGQPMPVAEVLRIAQQVLEALNYAHQQGVIHRDVKPSNILLDGSHAYLSDFGVAYLVSARRKTPTDSSGTCSYMSPEQIQASLTDQRSDVYGFGCVLYEMLTGYPPFPEVPNMAYSDDQIKLMHLTKAPASPRSRNPVIPPRLERVVLTALAKRPEDRFPGCGSFARALTGAIEGPVAPSKSSQVSLRKNLSLLLSGWILGLALFSALVFHDGQRELPSAALSLSLIGLVSWVTLLRLLHQSWKAIQDGVTRTSPGQAVGRLFIPGYNIYWLGRVFLGFPNQYNGYAVRHHVAARQDKAIYLVFCCVVWASMLFWPFPEIAVLISAVQQLVIIPVLATKMVEGINALQPAGGARS
jgi:serine/threonine protein kinase